MVRFNRKYVIKRSSVVGNATVPDPSKPAELRVSFGGYGPSGNKPNYFIQETDYENYSVIFSCDELIGFNIQFAWILTRNRGVAPSNLSDLEQKLEDAGVDTSYFFVVDQSSCTA
ncbi:apolipoprotein D-like [Elysia marginata]|uniref:Apolipoprotein D n=1 Tax=Elysia marginata TaxID=1093978 RepID=A0AAV4EJZ6_9GAST|nr:apolipoprotein D-like [Elysia marginata]